jgi:hypothetical protein
MIDLLLVTDLEYLAQNGRRKPRRRS